MAAIQNDESAYSAALNDFHQARNRALLGAVLARLTGSERRLLAYDDVRRELRLAGGVERGIREIPLDAIVGSVGRYADFSRDFLPLRESNRGRWAAVKAAVDSLTGLPPIEVYQIGEAYFVRDGNHRVSVARRLGAPTIQAYVTEVQTRVPLDPSVQPGDLIRLAEQARFLEQTRLDLLRPQADLSVSEAGQYPLLLNHIDVHRYYMGLDFQRDIGYEEAVGHWYDTVYLPLVEIIRSTGILARFPGRTEADLYLWVTEHRAALEDELGTRVRPEYAAHRLAEARSEAAEPLPAQLLARLAGRLLERIIPAALESGPPVGGWRAERASRPGDERLFADIVVPINGQEDGWCGLEQALVVARREAARVYGLHVFPAVEAEVEDDDACGPQFQPLRAEFDERCRRVGVGGALIITAGEVVEETLRRAAVTDLVALNLSHPPGESLSARWASGISELIRRSPRPVLATPQTVAPLNKGLAAFDGSPKAYEALFIAAYFAGRWGIPLTVAAVEVSAAADAGAGAARLEAAREYLESRGVGAAYRVESGPSVAEALLQAAEAEGCDFILTGGYGYSPVLELALGSTVNDLLRRSRIPLLICR